MTARMNRHKQLFEFPTRSFSWLDVFVSCVHDKFKTGPKYLCSFAQINCIYIRTVVFLFSFNFVLP